MLHSVKETHVAKCCSPKDPWTFWTYFIASVPGAGRRHRYNLIRVDNLCKQFEKLGDELTLGHCRRIVQENESGGTICYKHKVLR